MALLSRFRRRESLSPDELTVLMRRWLPVMGRLRPDEREHLTELTDALVRGLRWEAANGFAVTDDMRVAVSAHAALLVLAFDDDLDSYLSVSSIILHPSTIELHGTRSVGGGMVTDRAESVLGEAHHQGPILVSWDAAASQARNPQWGESVLLHEFAHRLDMLDGVSDGTPPIADADQMQAWVAACSAGLQRVRDGQSTVLRPYAGTNPGEFFAVATEVFFTLPAPLREHEPALYRVLRDYYRQDPASR
jgi:MtfA peptidase